MKKILITMVLIFVIFINFSTVNAHKVNEFDKYKYGDTFDIGSYIRIKEQNEDFLNQAEKTIKSNANKVNFTYDKKNKYFLNKDLEFEKFTLKGESDHAEVWIGKDIVQNEVTKEQIDKIMLTFDSKIYPEIIDFFGKPDFHDGTNAKLKKLTNIDEEYYYKSDCKIIILIDNINKEEKDDKLELSSTGYYSNLLEEYTDRNIITIDSGILDKRTEKTYFNSLVHEFQHLIHADNDKDEEIWLDEMMSYFAESLVFKNTNKNKADYFLDNTHDSFINWGNESDIDIFKKLSYSGEAYLLQSYLYDNYGESFLRTLAKDKDNGLDSMNKILKGFDTKTDTNKLFKKFHQKFDIN